MLNVTLIYQLTKEKTNKDVFLFYCKTKLNSIQTETELEILDLYKQ